MILLTGGSGLLGTELQKYLKCWAPPSSHFDILKPFMPADTDLIVHCAAYTDVLNAETDKETCHAVNVVGTRNVAALGIPLVYISTEYVFDGKRGHYREDDAFGPVNYYGRTKADGEAEARKAPESLVIRCLFKPRPYPHAKAPTDMWTTGDYVDLIAKQVAKAILLRPFFEKHDTIHLGTAYKSNYDLANESRDVDMCRRTDLPVPLPKDASLDTSKWQALLR